MIDTENNIPLIERIESGEFKKRPAELAQLALNNQDNLTPDELRGVLKSIASEKDESLNNSLGRNKIAETLGVNVQLDKLPSIGMVDVRLNGSGENIYIDYDVYNEFVDVELYISIFAEGKEPVEFLLETSVTGQGSKLLTAKELGFNPKETPHGYTTYLRKAR